MTATETRTRPILFSGPMVRALLDGRKTQTRRAVKPLASQDWLTPDTLNAVTRWELGSDGWWRMAVGEPRRIEHCGHEMDGGHIGCVRCPWQTGDLLWVRESWAFHPEMPRVESPDAVVYAATVGDAPEPHRWRPSIHMPRWACRIWLRVTDVRVQRVQEISDLDARAEGVDPAFRCPNCGYTQEDCGIHLDHNLCGQPWPSIQAFRILWDSINGERAGCSWADNPWVWAIAFERTEAPRG